MNRIKKQIVNLRKSTPQSVQWLLLGAAFIVVLILMTMLIGGRGNKQISTDDDVPIALRTVPETESVNWGNIRVGTTEKDSIKIFASAPVKVIKVRLNQDVPGFRVSETCGRMAQINENTSCTISMEYAPTAETDVITTALFIDWRGADQPDKMQKTDKIVLVLGAAAPEQPKTTTAGSNADTTKAPSAVAPAPAKADIKQEIATIAPADPFSDDTDYAAPAPTKKTEPAVVERTNTQKSEACSAFAFPGYNSTGTQIGWIKPENGAYYFHPFSDKECKNPTGTYNPDTGLITDIKNAGKKIGTDAEHIGYTTIASNGALPQLSNPVQKNKNRAYQLTTDELMAMDGAVSGAENASRFRAGITMNIKPNETIFGTSGGDAVYSSDPFDRTFVLRQYKPIPATIVSEVRADPSLYDGTEKSLPVRATVDRNVYSDNGRTVVIPAGTLMLGYVTGDIPGPYKTIGRMDIRWYQFILPSGVEFNFSGDGKTDPFSGDSQGRVGVPGYGSTDYVEQFVMPLLTSLVPAAVNMIAPISDRFVNQIDLDNNTVVQSGTVRSSELAKNEIITAWNQVAQKLVVDMMDNTVPPFSIAAGTRITVFPPTDLVITCGADNDKKCSMARIEEQTGLTDKRNQRADWQHSGKVDYADGSWVGQVRSFNLSSDYCKQDSSTGLWDVNEDNISGLYSKGYDYRTILMYCKSLNYQAKNNARQDAVYQNQQQQFKSKYETSSSTGGVSGQTVSGNQAYNTEILGLKYNEDGSIQNPFESSAKGEEQAAQAIITCEDGSAPDTNGCCTGEIYTDMGEAGFNCCPETGGDCFPPIL